MSQGRNTVSAKKGIICRASLALALAALVVFAMLPSYAWASMAFDSTAHMIGTSDSTVRAIAHADLDNDGDLDIISGNFGGEVIAWENNGSPFSGSWAHSHIGTAKDEVARMDTADLDKDGDPDIVVGCGPGDDYQIIAWENNGSPFSGPWARHDLAAVRETYCSNVLCADLDGDSWVDIACVGGGTGDLTVWQNDGTPFNGLWGGTILYTDYGMSGLALADLDKDGDYDFVFAYQEYFVRALENDGNPFDGAGALSPGWFVGTGQTHKIVAADFDKDGYMDVATAICYFPTIQQYVWRNDHTPFDNAWSGNAIGSTHAVGMDTADFNLDGNADLVMLTVYPSYNPVVWENDGTPFSGLWTRYDLSTATFPGDFNPVTAADLDGDGDEDVVAGSGPVGASDIVAYRNNAVVITTLTVTSITPNPLGNGKGNKVAHVTISGTNFAAKAKVLLRMVGQNDLKGKKVTVVSDTQIDCYLNLIKAAPGDWDVVVTNKDKESGTLEDGLKVTPHPVITSILTNPTPVKLGTEVVSLTINGSEFQDGATVKLTKGTIGTIDATIDSLASGKIECHFDMKNPPAHLGAWKILVTNPDGGIHWAPAFKVVVKPA